MATIKKHKKREGKLTKSEVISIRLDPRFRFGAELAAAKHRRSLASFAEWAIEEAMKKTNVGDKGETAFEIMEETWDVYEGYRFYKYASKCSRFLTPEEEKLWKVIKDAQEEYRRCVQELAEHETSYEPPDWKWERVVNEFYEDFKKCAAGKLKERELYKKIDQHIGIFFIGERYGS